MYPNIYPSQAINPESQSFYIESGPFQMCLNLASSPRRSLTSEKYAILKAIPLMHNNRVVSGGKLPSPRTINYPWTWPNCQNP